MTTQVMPHLVRSPRYGERLMTIAEFRQREFVGALVRALPRLGYFVRVRCVGQYLRHRLRDDFGTDDAKSIPAEMLDAAEVLLRELTAKARAHRDTTHESMRIFARDVIAAGRDLSLYGAGKSRARSIH